MNVLNPVDDFYPFDMLCQTLDCNSERVVLYSRCASSTGPVGAVRTRDGLKRLIGG